MVVVVVVVMVVVLNLEKRNKILRWNSIEIYSHKVGESWLYHSRVQSIDPPASVLLFPPMAFFWGGIREKKNTWKTG